MKKPADNLTLPDKFVLDKKDFVFVIDSIKSKWKRDDLNALENAAYIANMELIKVAVTFNNPKVLGELYFSIVEAVHQIETLNSLKLSSIENPEQQSFKDLFEIQKNKIKTGDAFIEN